MKRLCWSAAVVVLLVGDVRAQRSAPEPAGLTVVLLMDVSASVAHQPLAIDQRFAQVFNAFLQGLKPSDRGAVGVVSGRSRFTHVTGNPRDLSTAVRRLLQVPDSERLGPSPLWDALDEAITLAAADPGGRPAIVLFSDGKSSGNLRGLDEVIDRARRLRVRVSVAVEGADTLFLARTISPLDPADLLERLTEATGGLRLLDRPSDPRLRDPGPLVARIMDALQQQR